MPVLRLTSTKTFPLVLQILRRLNFTQTELSQDLQMSVGRVNKVVKVLIEKGIITKENAKYHVVQPNRLADIVAEEQTITKKRSYLVNLTKEELLKVAKKEGFIACLQTALGFHDKDDDYAVHFINDEKLQAYLNNLPRGQLQVNTYEFSTITKDDEHPATTIERTIIDLKSSNDSLAVEEVAQILWGTRQ